MTDEVMTPETPDLFEGMTAISAVLDESIRDFNDRRVLTVFVDKTRMDKKAREIAFLNRRAPGRDKNSTTRREPDMPEFLSGLTGKPQPHIAPHPGIFRRGSHGQRLILICLHVHFLPSVCIHHPPDTPYPLSGHIRTTRKPRTPCTHG